MARPAAVTHKGRPVSSNSSAKDLPAQGPEPSPPKDKPPAGASGPQPRAGHTSPSLLARSRDFRHPSTPPEAKVWEAVRDRRLGFKIRRQHPIGRFIADFYCAEAKLAIDIDGDVHASPVQSARDTARTAWLEERGYAVIRFNARKVSRDLEGVLEAIRAACEARTPEPK